LTSIKLPRAERHPGFFDIALGELIAERGRWRSSPLGTATDALQHFERAEAKTMVAPISPLSASRSTSRCALL
jgi:hypothetical protein